MKLVKHFPRKCSSLKDMLINKPSHTVQTGNQRVWSLNLHARKERKWSFSKVRKLKLHCPSSIRTASNYFQSHLQDCSVIFFFQMNLCKASCFPVHSLAQVSHLCQSLNCSSSGKAFGKLTQGTLLSSAVPPSSALCALCNDLPEIITKSCFYTAISYSKSLLSPLSRVPCPSLHLRWR